MKQAGVSRGEDKRLMLGKNEVVFVWEQCLYGGKKIEVLDSVMVAVTVELGEGRMKIFIMLMI